MQFDRQLGTLYSNPQRLPNLRPFPTIRDYSTRPVRIPEKHISIEDGIEVVAVEHRSSDSGKQVAVGDEEKEIVPIPEQGTSENAKPLPSVPGSRKSGTWGRVSVRNRILILVCIQACIMLSTCLGVISVSRRRVAATSNVEEQGVSAMASLQTGAFLTKVGRPQMQNSTCLAPSNETAVWSCSISGPKVFQFNMQPSIAEGQGRMTVSLEPLGQDNITLYGLQPPNIDGIYLAQLNDPDFPTNGPAFHFRTTYNRRVFLNEDQVVDQSPQIGQHNRHFMNVRPGDRPWSCVFNDTELEGYIYASQESSSAGVIKSESFMNYTTPVMPFLPYVLKIKEQRVNGTLPPACVQMEMLEDGRLVTLINEDGTMNLLKLKEEAPEGCRCQWMVD